MMIDWTERAAEVIAKALESPLAKARDASRLLNGDELDLVLTPSMTPVALAAILYRARLRTKGRTAATLEADVDAEVIKQTTPSHSPRADEYIEPQPRRVVRVPDGCGHLVPDEF